MKMANLLAVERDLHSGLSNVSQLDRQIVAEFTDSRERLGRRIDQLLERMALSHDEAVREASATLKKLRPGL
jgi:hypothetical protein